MISFYYTIIIMIILIWKYKLYNRSIDFEFKRYKLVGF